MRSFKVNGYPVWDRKEETLSAADEQAGGPGKTRATAGAAADRGKVAQTGAAGGKPPRIEPAPAKTRGPSPEKTARTREAIVKAAAEEFFEHGFSRATMAGVARRAGLAKGTAYLYFPTKEALFAGVVRHIVSDVLAAAEEREIEPGERIGDYFRRTLAPVMTNAVFAQRAAVARLVISEGAEFPFLAEIYRTGVFEPLMDHIRSHAERARARGELACDALVRLPQLLVGPIWVGIVYNGILNPAEPLDIGAMFSAQIDLLFPPSDKAG